MTQENVCFVDCFQVLTPIIIVSTHSPSISRKKQKKSFEERKIKMNKIMSQGSSTNMSIAAIALIVSICICLIFLLS